MTAPSISALVKIRRRGHPALNMLGRTWEALAKAGLADARAYQTRGGLSRATIKFRSAPSLGPLRREKPFYAPAFEFSRVPLTTLK
jgi:hypothetical protein